MVWYTYFFFLILICNEESNGYLYSYQCRKYRVPYGETKGSYGSISVNIGGHRGKGVKSLIATFIPGR